MQGQPKATARNDLMEFLVAAIFILVIVFRNDIRLDLVLLLGHPMGTAMVVYAYGFSAFFAATLTYRHRHDQTPGVLVSYFYGGCAVLYLMTIVAQLQIWNPPFLPPI